MTEFTSAHTTLSFTRFDSPGLELGRLGWSIWAVLLIIAATNAVNLTDGLDGLAAGASGVGYGAFMIIGFWQFDHYDSYQVAHALDLAVVSAAMVGAIIGFLWWNAAPARIFMGDTGSLALGSGLAALALATNTQLLLGHHRRAVRHRDPLGDTADHLVQGLRPAPVPHGALSTITSNCAAGPRPRSSCACGSCRACAPASGWGCSTATP